MTMQTLICQEGNHEWTRPAQRGKPPRYCSEHQPAAKAPRASGAESESGRDSARSAAGSSGGNQSTGASAGASASTNPFVLKAQRKAAEQNQTAAVAVSEPEPEQPIRFKKIEVEPITDSNSYHDASLPGVKIHALQRDTQGFWSCKLTLNEETFDLIRRGGWLIVKPDGTGWREALPHVAAAIQARVKRLEKSGGDIESETVTDVTDAEPMPMDEAMALIQDAAENDPFGSDGEFEEAHRANEAVLDGYNDILSRPEQYDGPYDDFADVIKSELG